MPTSHIPTEWFTADGAFSALSLALVVSILVGLRVLNKLWAASILARLPSTWLHEMAHLVVGLLLFGKPASFSLWPKKSGDTWVLGSVKFRNLTFWNAFPIAFAPLLLVLLGGLVFQHWMLPAVQHGRYLEWGLSGYVVASCFASCIPSSTDFKVGMVSGMVYAIVGYFLWTAGRGF